MRFDDACQQFVPERLPPDVHAAGRINGIYGLRDCWRTANVPRSMRSAWRRPLP